MAYDVRVNLNTTVVRNRDLEVIVKIGTGKLGTLLVSKGNLEWLPKGNYVNKCRLSWKQFAAVMNENGTRTTHDNNRWLGKTLSPLPPMRRHLSSLLEKTDWRAESITPLIAVGEFSLSWHPPLTGRFVQTFRA